MTIKIILILIWFCRLNTIKIKQKMNFEDLPNTIPIFPLTNFIIFPEITVPLNIFEKRYLQMVDDCMKTNRLIGMIQPKKTEDAKRPELYNVGCVGKITSFNETDDGRYLIVINGLIRFKITNEIENNKLYRECFVNFKEYNKDLFKNLENLNNNDLEIVFKHFKTLFKKQGYSVNWKDFKKKNVDQTINTLSMASPFTLEEKQMLLETLDLESRKNKLIDILKTYVVDEFSNTTIQ